MKIDELLYHLHHSASIPEIEATELNQLLKKYPYLESLRHAIIQNPNTPFQAINDIDLQNRFIQLAARAYNYDNPGNVMSPPIFDVTPGMPEQSLSLEEYHFTPVEASLPSPFELNFIQNDTDSEKTDPSSRQDILAASQDTLESKKRTVWQQLMNISPPVLTSKKVSAQRVWPIYGLARANTKLQSRFMRN